MHNAFFFFWYIYKMMSKNNNKKKFKLISSSAIVHVYRNVPVLSMNIFLKKGSSYILTNTVFAIMSCSNWLYINIYKKSRECYLNNDGQFPFQPKKIIKKRKKNKTATNSPIANHQTTFWADLVTSTVIFY